MYDLEEYEKHPLTIEVRPKRGYLHYGIACNILNNMGHLCQNMYEGFEPFRYRVEFCRRHTLKVRILFKSQEDQEVFALDERYLDLLFDLKRHCLPKKLLVGYDDLIIHV